MKGNRNMSGVKEQQGFTTLPEGEYDVKIAEITESTTRNGDPMASVKLVVISGEFQDQWCWDNIVIPELNSPGWGIMGRTKHFLHCIGQPYEGDNIEYDTDAWKWKVTKIRVTHEQPNEHHKYVKAIVAEYILDDTLSGSGEESPL